MQRRRQGVPGDPRSPPPPPSSVQVICVDRLQTSGLAEEAAQVAGDMLNEAVVTGS